MRLEVKKGLLTETEWVYHSSGLQYGTLHVVLWPADTVGQCLEIDSQIER